MPFQNFPYTNFQNLNLDWILKKVKEAVEQVDGAYEAAETALTAANSVQGIANQANATAAGASAAATNAVNTANAAETKANTAISNAESAINTANGAVTTANGASAQANSAYQNSVTAMSSASEAISRATSAENTASQALATVATKNTKIFMTGLGTSFSDTQGATLTRAQILSKLTAGDNLYFVKTDTKEIYNLFAADTNFFSIYHIQHDANNATNLYIITVPESGTVNVYNYPFPSGGSGGDGIYVINANYTSNYFTFDKTASQIETAIGNGLLPVVVYQGGNGQYQLFSIADYNFDGEDTYIDFFRNYRYSGSNYCDVLHFVNSESKAYKYTQNIGASANAVLYTTQSLTDSQKTQARINIGASTETIRETVAGTSATLDAEVDTMYLCGTMTALTIDTFPPTGEFTVVFTSGSTATTLTVPNTLHMPDGFTVEANKRYEINVLDGYACAQGWSVSA